MNESDLMETSDGGVGEGRGDGILSDGGDTGAAATGPPRGTVQVQAVTSEVQATEQASVHPQDAFFNSGNVGDENKPVERLGDTGVEKLNNSNCSRKDDDSIINDVESILEITDLDDSNVNLADLTFVNLPKSFKTININKSLIVKDGEKGEKEKGKEKEKDGEPLKKRLSNSERRFAKKVKMDEERGKVIREQNKGKPMSDIDIKINQELKKKTTYAQAAKTKPVMLEIRADNLEITLEQEDFNTLDQQLVFSFAELNAFNNETSEEEEDENDDKEKEKAIKTKIDDSDEEDEEDLSNDRYFCGYIGGLSQGACWFACDNKETAEFIRGHVPTIDPPNKGKYKYVVYEAEERPFRYLKGKIPKRYWASKSKLTNMLRMFNPCLRKTLPNHKNVKKLVHFKIIAGCVDPEETIIDNKYFWIQIEVDERLIHILTEPGMRGTLKLGASPINLYGGGIVSETKEKLKLKITTAANEVIDKDIRG